MTYSVTTKRLVVTYSVTLFVNLSHSKGVMGWHDPCTLLGGEWISDNLNGGNMVEVDRLSLTGVSSVVGPLVREAQLRDLGDDRDQWGALSDLAWQLQTWADECDARRMDLPDDDREE